MKIKTARKIYASLLVVLALCLLVGTISRNIIWAGIGFVVLVVFKIFPLFYRCPKCGIIIHSLWFSYCHHCGEKLIDN